MKDNSFNLVDERWIPCAMTDASAKSMGIEETLTYAPQIREIFHPSPLVTLSLHRLLLAILHRNFGPATVGEWQSIWRAGRFDGTVLKAYLAKWRPRFNLFDDSHPFYQVADFGARQNKTALVNELMPERARGNNPTLFDHSFDHAPSSLDAAAAARGLVAIQSFKLGGRSGLGPNFVDAPAARFVAFLARGANLFETLMLNLVKYGKDEPMPATKDAPIWEQQVDPDSPVLSGYLDYLTWQTIRARLVLDEAESSHGPFVSRVTIALGRDFPKEGTVFDPARAYRMGKKGWLGLRFREERALWRDSAALLNLAGEDGSSHHLGVTAWLGTLVKRGALDPDDTYTLEAYGQGTNQARIDFWRKESLPVPTTYLKDEYLLEDIRTALGRAEETGRVLRNAGWALAAGIIPGGDSKAGRDASWELLKHMAVEKHYWSRLEQPFYQLLTLIPTDRDQGHTGWTKVLRTTAYGGLDEAVRDLDRSARTTKAAIHARAVLAYGLAKVLNQD